MKLFIPAAALLGVVLLSSCSSMYRTGQTPDDVYYSPGRTNSAVARNSNDGDEYDYVNPDDNYLRQKVQNRSRWSTIDDADYWYSYNRPYSNFSYGYNAYNSPFYSNGLSVGYGNYSGFDNYYGYNSFGGYPFWNTFNYGYPGSYGYSNYGSLYGSHGYYGGYYPGTVIVNQPLRSNTGPKPYMGGFTNNSFNNSNNGQRNSSRLGSFMRSTIGNSNSTSRPASTYDNNTNRPARTFTPATPSSTPSYSPSSSSRGSSGSSSGGSRPSRGGN